MKNDDDAGYAQRCKDVMFYQIRKDKISPCTLSSALNAEVGGEMVRLVTVFIN